MIHRDTIYPPSLDDIKPSFKVIDNTEKAMVKYGLNYGHTISILTDKDIDMIKNGKALATDDGEYAYFFIHEDFLKELHLTCIKK